ncbi:MAG: SURF1 family protein [Pseudomonadales bacterium]|nr:SURF1 family protein [Pseudomonadales bacterium]
MTKPPGGWVVLAQVTVAVAVTICLSAWQVTRGVDKMEFKRLHAQAFQAPALPPGAWGEATPDYTRVRAVGSLDPDRFFLIENRRHHGRPGYWVVGLLHSGNDTYLVNRGWVSVAGNVRQVPKFNTPANDLEAIAVKWPSSTSAVQLQERNDAWPYRLRSLNVARMSELANAGAFELRLLSSSPGVLTPAPLELDFSTTKHWGYAVQWLLIGSAIVGGYWYFFLRLRTRQRVDSA